jgi:hypothetical protein
MQKILAALVFCISSSMLIAQDYGRISGNFQTDFQYYLRDSLIDPTGAAFPDERLLGTGFLNLTYQKGNFIAGIRYENYQNNRVGLPPDYKGEGITYRYARFIKDKWDITAGNFYEQFGSGLVLRAYEERGLGLDNNLDGIRTIFTPVEGLTFKGLIGRQRNFFEKSNTVVRGIDGEWNIGSTLDLQNNMNVVVGASFTSKFQEFSSPLYYYPQNVGAGAFRASIITSKINISGEYAYKGSDPSTDNEIIYKPGHAFYMSGSYTEGSLGITGELKYYDNFSFRSEPNTQPQQLLIGYLPSATTLHTYALPALYSYNTALTGEQGYQVGISYYFKRGTPLGGKYGLKLEASFAQSFALNKEYDYRLTLVDTLGNNVDSTVSGTDGYTVKPGAGSIRYFQDFHIQIKKKLNKKISFTGTYYNFYFNSDAIRKGTAGVADYQLYPNADNPDGLEPNAFPVNAVVLDILWKIKKSHSLRTEIQGLWTDGQDDRFGGDWALLLLEYSIAPHWFVAVQDAYNYGNGLDELQIHYLSVNGGYTLGTTKLQIGYGRQQEGVFCVGGICRVVPASNGFTLGLTTNF